MSAAVQRRQFLSPWWQWEGCRQATVSAILSGNVARRTRKLVLEVQRAVARVLKDLATVGENAADSSLKRRSVEIACREAHGLLVKDGIDERRARGVPRARP